MKLEVRSRKTGDGSRKTEDGSRSEEVRCRKIEVALPFRAGAEFKKEAHLR